MNTSDKPDLPPGSTPVHTRKNRVGWLWLERISLATGLALLLAFAGFKLGQDKTSEAGLAAFYEQVESAGLEESSSNNRGTEPTDEAALLTALPPDREFSANPPGFENWSEKRQVEYQQSLLQQTAPPLGILRIQRLGIEVPVYNGTDDSVLNRGVGRILGTAGIDDPGNLGIAGHRDGFFRGLKDIQTGDVLELQSIHGAVQYRVGSTVIVDPSDVSVLAPTPERTLTLVTCYPFYFVGQAPKRFIVQATAESQIAMN